MFQRSMAFCKLLRNTGCERLAIFPRAFRTLRCAHAGQIFFARKTAFSIEVDGGLNATGGILNGLLAPCFKVLIAVRSIGRE